MKKSYFLLCLFLLALPSWADEDLSPEPVEQALKEYRDLWKADSPDPMNHEIWKLYVYYPLIVNNGFNNNVPELLVAGLTPRPRDGYKVLLRINQLYNFFRPAPGKGDVLVVEGRVRSRVNMNIRNTKTEFVLRGLDLYAQGAQKLAGEHFEPYPVGTALSTPSSTPVALVNATPAVLTPGLPVK